MFTRIHSFFNTRRTSFLTRFVLSTEPGTVRQTLRQLALYQLLRESVAQKSLSALWTKASQVSSLAALLGIRYNVNHLGNVYALSTEELRVTQHIEKQVLEWNKKLVHAPESVEGYITAGGTESNMFLMWAGREWLAQFSSAKPTLLITDFTHYSVRKSGRILSLKEKRVAVSEKNWGMDPNHLRQLIEELVATGVKTFLIPITLGYSSNGACDPLEKILRVLKQAQAAHDVHFFVWVDAAMQGLSLSFLSEKFAPFSHELVQGYVIDFHKLGEAPLPTGIVLYRQDLRPYIETEIEYLDETDATLSGSRPGFAALAIWANIYKKSTAEWKAFFQTLHEQKEQFVRQLKVENPGVEVIDTPMTLTIGIIVNEQFPRLPTQLEIDYGLVMAEISYHCIRSKKLLKQKLGHYKVHFLSTAVPFLQRKK